MVDQKVKSELKVFALNSNRPLAEKVAQHLGLELGKATISRYNDGEISVNIEESIRGDHVFLIQSTSAPVDAHLMETLIMMDALRRASAQTINVVLPYYGYARQDRKARPREPITAKLVANLLETAGATRVIGLDFHAVQLQGFFDIPVDHLFAASLLAEYFLKSCSDREEIVVVAPDHSGVSRARKLAEFLQAPIAIIDKRRPKSTVASAMKIVGEVEGKTCILADDLIDTAVTVSAAAQALKNNGAKEVYATATHAVFSGSATKRLEESSIEKVVVTDSIYLPEEKQIEKVVQISVGELLADAIKCVYENRSISPLYEKKYDSIRKD